MVAYGSSALHPTAPLLPSPHNLTSSEATTTNLVDTVLKLAREVGEMFTEVPYIKAVAGILIQIIAIRDEIKTTKERSVELINKVLRRSKVVLDGLLSVAMSPRKELLARMELNLIDYHKLLSEVQGFLQRNKLKGLFHRIIHRKSDLSEVETYDRLIDNYNIDFLTDFLLQSHITGLPQESAPSVMTSDP
ncbi:hypothetical protein H0H87_003351 [Tephrocybe sp. NHM501043]|nr:hypothetical protein H0H87_003351 [Tephrocybe sp. NHM501043]